MTMGMRLVTSLKPEQLTDINQVTAAVKIILAATGSGRLLQYVYIFRRFISQDKITRLSSTKQKFFLVIEPKYLKALCNSITHNIIKSIPQFFDYLFKMYGNISPQELRALTAEVEAL